MSNFTCLAAARDAVLRPRRLGRRARRPDRRAAGPGARRGRAPRHRRPGPALPRASARRSRCAADDQGRIDPDALANALARCRPERRRSWCCRRATCTPGAFDPFGAGDRGARMSTAPGCTSTAPSACSPPRHRLTRHLVARLRAGRLVDHRRAQDAQRPLRLRHRDRRRPRRAARRDGHARRLPHPRRGGRLVRDRARGVAARPGDPGLGGAARARPVGRGRPG